jgi:integrase
MFKPKKTVFTFKAYAEQWLAMPHPEWKGSTLSSHTGNLKKHCYPVFGKTPLDKITRKDLKAFFNKLLAKGKAPGTVALIRAGISGVLASAVEDELIPHNPLRDIRFSKVKRHPEIKPLTEDEAEKLLAAARGFLGGQYHPHMLCALRTGMRLGELKALQWSDIDFENRQIEVRRSCRRGVVSDTKNHKDRRVDMTPQLAETLQDLRLTQKKRAIKKGGPFSDYVFANNRGEIFLRVPFENALNRCLAAAKLRRIRIHDLRHTYANIRISRGHNMGDVSKQLGHSSIKITFDVYGHLETGNFKSEIDELDSPRNTAPQNTANGCV